MKRSESSIQHHLLTHTRKIQVEIHLLTNAVKCMNVTFHKEQRVKINDRQPQKEIKITNLVRLEMFTTLLIIIILVLITSFSSIKLSIKSKG